MNPDLSDNDLIERFLLGKMDDAEERRFKLRMEDDRELARKCRMLKMFPEMMSEPARAEYHKQHASEESAAKPETRKSGNRKKNFRVIILFLGVACILAVAGYFYLDTIKNTTPTEVPAPVTPQTDSVKAPAVAAAPDTARDSVIQPVAEPVKTMEEKGVQPVSDAKLSRNERIIFRWENPVDTFSRLYVISDATQKIIMWRGVKPGEKQYEIDGKLLKPGKYYWYFGTPEKHHTFTVTEE